MYFWPLLPALNYLSVFMLKPQARSAADVLLQLYMKHKFSLKISQEILHRHIKSQNDGAHVVNIN